MYVHYDIPPTVAFSGMRSGHMQLSRSLGDDVDGFAALSGNTKIV